MTKCKVVETIFLLPGIGNFVIKPIYQRDYPANSYWHVRFVSVFVV